MNKTQFISKSNTVNFMSKLNSSSFLYIGIHAIVKSTTNEESI